jgi:cold shock CspA family protein
MHKGTVKFFDTAKCFGFIETPEKEEIYVHAGDLIDLIKKNDLVSYDVETDKGKLCAVNVRIVKRH